MVWGPVERFSCNLNVFKGPNIVSSCLFHFLLGSIISRLCLSIALMTLSLFMIFSFFSIFFFLFFFFNFYLRNQHKFFHILCSGLILFVRLAVIFSRAGSQRSSWLDGNMLTYALIYSRCLLIFYYFPA